MHSVVFIECFARLPLCTYLAFDDRRIIVLLSFEFEDAYVYSLLTPCQVTPDSPRRKQALQSSTSSSMNTNMSTSPQLPNAST